MIEYPLDELAAEFKRQAVEFENYKKKWHEEHPEVVQKESYFNLPGALHTLAKEIQSLRNSADILFNDLQSRD